MYLVNQTETELNYWIFTSSRVALWKQFSQLYPHFSPFFMGIMHRFYRWKGLLL